jgi:hypothetical protein
MKRVLILLAGAIMLVSSTGCCCLSKLWCHHWGMCPWGGCQEEACGEACGDSCGESCGAGGCDNCNSHHGHGLIGHHPRHAPGQGHFGTNATYAGPSGPPTGAVAYPYYTNRGPRDFLADNPPSIGP